MSIRRWHEPSGYLHRGQRASDRKNWNRRIEMDGAAAPRRRRGGNEGADLEAALPGVAINLLVGVGQHAGLVLARPAVEKIAIPGLVDHAAVGRRRPMRNAAGAYQRDALRNCIGSSAKSLAEGPGPMQRR